MTSSQILLHIRTGIRLITDAMCSSQMNFNHAYSLGQTNLALHQGVIGDLDWKELQEDIKLAVEAYKEKNK